MLRRFLIILLVLQVSPAWMSWAEMRVGIAPGAGYRAGRVARGERVFTDRLSTFADVPELLAGAVLLRPTLGKMGDYSIRRRKGSCLESLTENVSVSAPCTMFVSIPCDPLPRGVSSGRQEKIEERLREDGWQRLPESLVIGGHAGERTVDAVYAKAVPAGSVSFDALGTRMLFAFRELPPGMALPATAPPEPVADDNVVERTDAAGGETNRDQSTAVMYCLNLRAGAQGDARSTDRRVEGIVLGRPFAVGQAQCRLLKTGPDVYQLEIMTAAGEKGTIEDIRPGQGFSIGESACSITSVPLEPSQPFHASGWFRQKADREDVRSAYAFWSTRDKRLTVVLLPMVLESDHIRKLEKRHWRVPIPRFRQQQSERRRTPSVKVELEFTGGRPEVDDLETWSLAASNFLDGHRTDSVFSLSVFEARLWLSEFEVYDRDGRKYISMKARSGHPALGRWYSVEGPWAWELEADCEIHFAD